MAIVKGGEYTRDEILSELGVSAAQRNRAVLLSGDTVEAIVIKKNGVNPFNGKTYVNALTSEKLVMTGESDPRGKLLEVYNVEMRLFFSEKDPPPNENRKYKYVGMVTYKGKLPVSGDPIREFDVVP